MLSYFLLGFTVAAMPGAVFAETIRRSLSERDTLLSFTAGNFLGLGAIAAATYLGLAAFAQNQSILSALYYVGGGIIIIVGIKALLHKAAYHTMHRKAASLKEEWTSFSMGLILAVSNPLRILFWVSLMGAILYGTDGQTADAVVQGGSVYFGMLAFYGVLTCLLLAIGDKVSINKFAHVSRVLGVVLIAYGVDMILKGAS